MNNRKKITIEEATMAFDELEKSYNKWIEKTKKDKDEWFKDILRKFLGREPTIGDAKKCTIFKGSKCYYAILYYEYDAVGYFIEEFRADKNYTGVVYSFYPAPKPIKIFNDTDICPQENFKKN